MRRAKVSIIIVVYNGELKRLENCLKSIDNSKPKISFEVIVVNNGTEDEGVQNVINKSFIKARYIKSPRNGGYGAGNNLGAKNAKGKYLFIFNNDTKLLSGAIDTLGTYLDTHPKFAIVAPNLVDEKGKPFQRTGTRILTPIRAIFAMSFIDALFPQNKIAKDYYMDDVPNSELRETDSVPGAAFLIRKNIFEKVGMFDENIFLFMEEQDLGKRVRDVGYKIAILPEATVYHQWTHKQKHEGIYEDYSHQSRFYYFKKHYGILWALTVEGVCRFSKRKAILAVGVILTVLLIKAVI